MPSAIRLITTILKRRKQFLRSIKSLQVLDDLVTNEDIELERNSRERELRESNSSHNRTGPQASSRPLSARLGELPTPPTKIRMTTSRSTPPSASPLRSEFVDSVGGQRQTRLSYQLSQHPLAVARKLAARPRPLSILDYDRESYLRGPPLSPPPSVGLPRLPTPTLVPIPSPSITPSRSYFSLPPSPSPLNFFPPTPPAHSHTHIFEETQSWSARHAASPLQPPIPFPLQPPPSPNTRRAGRARSSMLATKASITTLELGSMPLGKEFAEGALAKVGLNAEWKRPTPTSAEAPHRPRSKTARRFGSGFFGGSIASRTSHRGQEKLQGTARGCRSEQKLAELKETLNRTERLLITIGIQFLLACGMAISYGTFCGKLPLLDLDLWNNEKIFLLRSHRHFQSYSSRKP